MSEKIGRRKALGVIGGATMLGVGSLLVGCNDPGPGPTVEVKPTVDPDIDKKIAEWDKYRQSVLPSYRDFDNSVWHLSESSSKYTSSKKTLEYFQKIAIREQKIIEALRLFGVQTKEGLQLPRWSTPDQRDKDGKVVMAPGGLEAMKITKCNRYAQQLAMVLTYGIGGAGPHMSSMYNQERTQPLIYSLPGNRDNDPKLPYIQMSTSEIGDWMESEDGKKHGWSQMQSDQEVTEALERGELLFGVTEDHADLLFKHHGKIVCSQASTDKMMESEDEMRKNEVDWKMRVGGEHGVRIYAHKIVE